LLEVIDDRTGTGSTIVTSQFSIKKWHDAIGDPSIADALLDHILATSTEIALKSRLEKRLWSHPDEACIAHGFGGA